MREAPTWRDLQRDQVTLSERGCQIIAEQSGHVVPIDQPQVVVDAIRAIVDLVRGRYDVPLCGSRVTLKTADVQPIAVPPRDADVVRETREALHMSRQVFAFKIGVNPRTLERWDRDAANRTSRPLP